jgi:peptidoglycan/xylan/chitin deacetylase (PgdA/CDA1 family)
MALRRIMRVRRGLRQVVRRFGPRALILMYHRVAAKDLDPWSLCVTPGNFAEQLDVLRKHTRTMALGDLAGAHQAGRLPHRAAAITFDDGYANNLHQAKPLLEQYGVPGTVFVATAYVGKRREFWWDELDQVVLRPGRLPDTLRLTIAGGTRHWDLKLAADYTAAEHEADSDRAEREERPSPRLSFYYSLWQALLPLPEPEREQALNAILAWANATPVLRSTHRPLEPGELPVLAAGGLIDIGAHTVTHPLLPVQTPDVQRDEIRQSKSYLDSVLGRSVTAFSYPFGQYSREAIPLVRDAGFSCACACNVPEPVWWRSDSYELPRFEVQDWSGDEFERRLLQWLNS